METTVGILMGVALSATCGLRVFVPLLGVSIAAATGHMHVADRFEGIGSPWAITLFSVATALEIGTYYVPWLDNLMDSVASFAAVAAGTVITATLAVETPPFFQWTLALIAGGGIAGVVQMGTVLFAEYRRLQLAGSAIPLSQLSNLAARSSAHCWP